MSTLVIDNIGLLVTNDPSSATVRDAALVVRGRARRRRSSAPAARPPTSASTRAGAASSRASSTATRTSSSPASAATSSPRGWRARRTPRAASARRSPRRARRATSELRALAHARRARGAAGGHHARRDQVRLRPRRRQRGSARARSPPTLTDDVTFLGAHVVPRGRRDADDYVALVCGDDARRVRAARALDRRLLRDRRVRRRAVARGPRRPAAPPGLGLRIHANQLGPGPGVQLAVELGAASADHCTYLTDADIDALAGSDTVATFLPATDFSTRQPYPDARRAIDAGVQRRDRDELQPRLELHDLDGVLHRARRARHADDRRGGARRRDARRRPRAAARRRRPPRAGRARRRGAARRAVLRAPRLPPGRAARRD